MLDFMPKAEALKLIRMTAERRNPHPTDPNSRNGSHPRSGTLRPRAAIRYPILEARVAECTTGAGSEQNWSQSVRCWVMTVGQSAAVLMPGEAPFKVMKRARRCTSGVGFCRTPRNGW